MDFWELQDPTLIEEPVYEGDSTTCWYHLCFVERQRQGIAIASSIFLSYFLKPPIYVAFCHLFLGFWRQKRAKSCSFFKVSFEKIMTKKQKSIQIGDIWKRGYKLLQAIAMSWIKESKKLSTNQMNISYLTVLHISCRMPGGFPIPDTCQPRKIFCIHVFELVELLRYRWSFSKVKLFKLWILTLQIFIANLQSLAVLHFSLWFGSDNQSQ